MKNIELLQAVDSLLDIMTVYGNGGFHVQQDMLKWLQERLSSGISPDSIDKSDFLRTFYYGKENFSSFYIVLNDKTEMRRINLRISANQDILSKFVKEGNP